MQARITKQRIDAISPADKPIFVFDTDLAGFVLKVTPTGKRTYQLRYRMGGRDTPLKTFTIGEHGRLTPDQARKLAQSLLGDVRRGIDPAAEKARKREEQRGARTVAQLSAEFLDVYGATQLKPRSLEEYRRAFEQHINPHVGGLKVKDVTHVEVERLHHEMRAMPPTANRTIAALSKFFSWAIRSGYRPDRQNPCQGLQKFKEQPRQRYLSEAEISALGGAITDCEKSDTITPWHAALFRCLLLTGMRRDELRTLRWDHVDTARRVFALPDSKVGRRDVPIATPVAEILHSIPRIDGNPYVFVGSNAGQPIVNLAKPWKRVHSASGIAPARIHDLRHSAASVGVANGASLLLIGGVLGHKSQNTTQRYAHLSDDPVRATSEAIANQIADCLTRSK